MDFDLFSYKKMNLVQSKVTLIFKNDILFDTIGYKQNEMYISIRAMLYCLIIPDYLFHLLEFLQTV